MHQQKVPYESFAFRSDAEALQELLLKNGIICVLDFPDGFFDNSWFPTLDKNRTVKYYTLMLDSSDFTKADQIQFENFKVLQTELDEDYPLYHFTDLELFDVLEKFESWSKFDYFMAHGILEYRGLPVNDDTLKKMKIKRINELARPYRATQWELAKAYMLIPFLGYGLFFGAHFRRYKSLPDGKIVHAYDAYSRKHGLIIVILGLLCFIGWLTAYIVSAR
jgi:hypothetical protein